MKQSKIALFPFQKQAFLPQLETSLTGKWGKVQIGALGVYDCSSGIINILHTDGDLIVRNGTAKDMLFVDKLQKENSYAIGFIPNTYWEKCVFGGEKNAFILVCEKNNDMVWYSYITPGFSAGFVRIQQIAVRNDARRLHYGSAILSVIKIFCERFGRVGARLRCRVDLESNHFWLALGFRLCFVWKKGRINHSGFKASKDINHYEIKLNNAFMELPLIVSVAENA